MAKKQAKKDAKFHYFELYMEIYNIVPKYFLWFERYLA